MEDNLRTLNLFRDRPTSIMIDASAGDGDGVNRGSGRLKVGEPVKIPNLQLPCICVSGETPNCVGTHAVRDWAPCMCLPTNPYYYHDQSGRLVHILQQGILIRERPYDVLHT